MKNGLIGVGLVAIVAVVFISHKKAQKTQEETVMPVALVAAASSQLSRENKTRGDDSVSFAETSVSKDKVEASISKDQKVTWNSEKLSEAVQILLSLDGKEHNYPELLQAVAELGYDLSTADVAALREMLAFPNDRFPAKMRPIEINAVKNDILDCLLRQKQLSVGLDLQMAEMASNPKNDPVWRDYSIQFMGQFYGRFAAERGSQTTEDGNQRADIGGQKDAESSAIHDALFSALDERSETLAGTALIGLELLSRTHEEFDRPAIVAKSLEIAADESASSSCRLTALRLSTLTGKSDSAAADLARSLAQTGDTLLLRSAAIVTLGEVGTADDRELLNTFALSDNKQIAAASRLALQKMDAKAN